MEQTAVLFIFTLLRAATAMQPTISVNGRFIVGRTKTIACYIYTAETVNGFPIAWSRGGKRLTASDEQTVKAGSTVTYTAFYKLTVAASDNLAVFTCTATLPSGTTSATTTVYVLKGPDSPVIRGPAVVTPGQPGRWTCVVNGTSGTSPSVVWKFGNGTRLPKGTVSNVARIWTDGNGLEIHVETSTLTLNVTNDLPFTLLCEAYHYETNIHKAAQLPVIVLKSGSYGPSQMSCPSVWKSSENVMLTCLLNKDSLRLECPLRKNLTSFKLDGQIKCDVGSIHYLRCSAADPDPLPLGPLGCWCTENQTDYALKYRFKANKRLHEGSWSCETACYDKGGKLPRPYNISSEPDCQNVTVEQSGSYGPSQMSCPSVWKSSENVMLTCLLNKDSLRLECPLRKNLTSFKLDGQIKCDVGSIHYLRCSAADPDPLPLGPLGCWCTENQTDYALKYRFKANKRLHEGSWSCETACYDKGGKLPRPYNISSEPDCQNVTVEQNRKDAETSGPWNTAIIAAVVAAVLLVAAAAVHCWRRKRRTQGSAGDDVVNTVERNAVAAPARKPLTDANDGRPRADVNEGSELSTSMEGSSTSAVPSSAGESSQA